MNASVALKKNKLSVLIPCVAAFIVMLFLRDFGGKSIPSILFLGITVLVALFADKTEIVAFCFCFIPILNAFQSKYALLICMAIYIARFVRIKSIPLYTIPIAFLMLWEILHGFVSEISYVEVLRQFVELIFCCFIMSLPREDIDFKKIIRFMSFVAVCAYGILLLSHLKQYDYQTAVLFSGVFRLGYAVDESKMAIGFNPNYLSYICLCCIEGLVVLMYKKQNNSFDLFCLGALGVFGFLTMSRKFILCAAALLILIFLSYKKKFKFFLMVTVILLAVIFVFQLVFPTAAQGVISRFAEEDLGGGRDRILGFYNEKLGEDMGLLFFGLGLQDLESKARELYNTTIPHNGFQELLVIWGIPGFIAFAAFLLMLLGQAKKRNPQIKLINYTPFLIMMLNVMVSQMASSSVVVSCIAIVYICLIVDPNTETESCNS